MNKNITQCERIKDYLEENGSITQLEALKELGIMRLASRMSELKKQGYKFKTKFKTIRNRFDEEVIIAEYFKEKKDE